MAVGVGNGIASNGQQWLAPTRRQGQRDGASKGKGKLGGASGGGGFASARSAERSPSAAASMSSPQEPPPDAAEAETSLAPEPPRWRFVKEAKKSAGYGSEAAGTAVAGKTSEELGAAYVAPDIADAAPDERVAAELLALRNSSRFERAQREAADRREAAERLRGEGREVGRLSVAEPPAEHEDIQNGNGGIVVSHEPKNSAEPSKRSMIWAMFHRSKNSDRGKECDKDKGSTLMEGGHVSLLPHGGVGRLQFSPNEHLDEAFEFEGPFSKQRLNDVRTSEEAADLQALADHPPQDHSMPPLPAVETDDVQEGQGRTEQVTEGEGMHENVNFNHMPDDSGGSGNDASSLSSSMKSGVEERAPVVEASPFQKYKKWTLIPSFLLLVAAAVIGGVLGGKDPSTRPTAGGIFAGTDNSTHNSMEHSPLETIQKDSDVAHLGQIVKRPPFDDLFQARPAKPINPLTQPPLVASYWLPISAPPSQSASPTMATKARPAIGSPPVPTGDPSASPIAAPSTEFQAARRTSSPSLSPSNGPTTPPSEKPTTSPSGILSGSPTEAPSPLPWASPPPTVGPSKVPSSTPTYPPYGEPTVGPSVTPSEGPTTHPSKLPSGQPSTSPFIGFLEVLTDEPSELPSNWPSKWPSGQPTTSTSVGPSEVSTNAPSESPSKQRTVPPSRAPSRTPTNVPSKEPTPSPSGSPLEVPTTGSPSNLPSRQPTVAPSKGPSRPPTRTPLESPSIGPTLSPSEIPSASPTRPPSKAPTLRPTPVPTRLPSLKPTRAPTELPSDQPTKEPTNRPSNRPSTEKPTKNPTGEPTRKPSERPTGKPTKRPSQQPTKKPTDRPTQAPIIPTQEPTCAENGNFNLCVALDMSGSVCNGAGSGLCMDCPDACNSGGQNRMICCSNFGNMLDFSRDLILLLGELPTEQDFSVVHFGTVVAIASSLQSHRQAVKTIKQLKYTGGMTNLAGAISSCQETLASAPPDRANLMLIITDGAPSVANVDDPNVDPAGAAGRAATIAEEAGTFLIPILIEEVNNPLSAELSFLRESISSDGKVFVADFQGLADLEENIFEQITCQATQS